MLGTRSTSLLFSGADSNVDCRIKKADTTTLQYPEIVYSLLCLIGTDVIEDLIEFAKSFCNHFHKNLVLRLYRL